MPPDEKPSCAPSFGAGSIGLRVVATGGLPRRSLLDPRRSWPTLAQAARPVRHLLIAPAAVQRSPGTYDDPGSPTARSADADVPAGSSTRRRFPLPQESFPRPFFHHTHAHQQQPPMSPGPKLMGGIENGRRCWSRSMAA